MEEDNWIGEETLHIISNKAQKNNVRDWRDSYAGRL